MANLEQNLAEYQLSTQKIPVILQYNKRDLPNALSVDQLNADLNPRGWPWFEGVAVKGDGVWETFRAAVDALFKSLERTLGGESGDEAAEKTSAADKAVAGLVDPRFAGKNTEEKAARPVDEVVRVSASIEQLTQAEGPAEDAARPSREKTDEEPIRREAAVPALGKDERSDEKPVAPEGRVTLHGRVESFEDSGGVEGAGAAPDSRRQASSGVEARPDIQTRAERKAEPPVAGAEARTSAAVPSRESGTEKRVVRVPVELDGGSGTVRLEIALEIEIRDTRERVPEPALVDSGEEWK